MEVRESSPVTLFQPTTISALFVLKRVLKKAKFTLEQAMKTKMGRRGIAQLFP